MMPNSTGETEFRLMGWIALSEPASLMNHRPQVRASFFSRLTRKSLVDETAGHPSEGARRGRANRLQDEMNFILFHCAR